MRLRTLGHLELHDGDVQFLARRRKELVLIAVLAQESPAPVARRDLMRLLWEDRDEARARHSLRQALSDIRRVFGDALTLTPDAAALAAGTVTTDAMEFLAACTDERWDDAIALWQGDFLRGAHEAGGSRLAAWLAEMRSALHSALTRACEQRCVAAERAGQWSKARSSAEWWSRHAPESGAARSHLAGVLRAVGRRSEAERLAGFDRGPVTTLREPDFIGREAELDTITRAWFAARAGKRQMVVVSGLPGSGRSRLLREFARLVGERWPRTPVRRITESPLPSQPMLVLADLAAAPETSAALSDFLATPGEGALLLVTASPELAELRAIGAATPESIATTRLRLQSLTLADTRELLASMASLPDRLLDSLSRRLHADTDGHPAAVVRAMSLLVSEGMVVCDPSAGWQATPGLGVAPLALDDAQERTRRRLDRMHADSRRVVDAAAVLAGAATNDLLAAVSGIRGDRFDAAIAEATRRRLLEQHGGHYHFAADSVRDAVYAMIPDARVRGYHRAAARALRRAARADARLHPEVQRHRARAGLGFDRPWHLRLAAALGIPVGR
ncbi:MAG TPA: AAA family ATPase [Gemmatimonadales bacterium]|nr:AAA family ATPase [Gemmatimonadales bacterium]